jgi:alpha-beta hydrolase superfamily lysophospholipase
VTDGCILTDVVPNRARSLAAGYVRTCRERRALRRQAIVAAIGSVGVAALFIGCAAPANRGTTGLLAEEDWPPRITAGLKQLATNTSAVLNDDRGDLSALLDAADAEHEPQALPSRVVRCAPHGLGLVFEFAPTIRDGAAHPPSLTELAFVSFSTLTPQGRRLEREQAGLPGEITPSDLRTGVRWHLYEAREKPPRGLVVHLGGNKYVRRALLAHGWAVLSSPGTGRYSHRRQSPTTFEVEAGGDVEALAARLAATIDDELADWPYSLEAVLDYLADHRPDVPQEPLVIMGFSIGALGLPAVVARLPDRFEAAVIVAGGADLLEISQRSSKPDSGIELKWNVAEPTQADWQQLYAAYRAHARLDPYHTAAALADVPVLVCHAQFDQVVPAATGELLYARLGRPQRFTYPVGHKHLLRVVMRLQAERIVEWVEAALARQPSLPDELHGR